MKRNGHPYLSATYINGYVKDTPLRKMNENEVMGYITKANEQFGRSALNHNGNKVVSNGTSEIENKKEVSSIQGKWTSSLWSSAPQHMIEAKIEYQTIPFEPLPMRPVKNKRVRPHRQTVVARKKPPIVSEHNIY